MCTNSVLRQENFLKKIEEELNKAGDKQTDVELKLNELRNELLRDKQIRFYMCADLNKLKDSISTNLDKIWIENFPADQSLFSSKDPFKVDLTWHLKKGLDQTHSQLVYTPEAKQDYIINIGSTESSFLRLISSCDILSYDHPSYPGLLVLIEYFTQTEVPT